MPPNQTYIEFEGLFAPNVLGIFRIIRGFADLRDLAMISVPYEMQAGVDPVRVVGHQRAVSEEHARAIKRYLESSENRFLPEVILSVRVSTDLLTERGLIPLDNLSLGDRVIGVEAIGGLVEIKRKYGRKTMQMQRLRIRRSNIAQIQRERVFRRIDGNHRLHLAEELSGDDMTPDKYVAAFCMVLLDEASDGADDYSESLIFHTINSKGLPLDSEHGLRLLLGQHPDHEMTPDHEFTYSPELHLTRLLHGRLLALPQATQERFGSYPLSALHDVARSLISMDNSIARDRSAMEDYADDLLGALFDLVTLSKVSQPALCRTSCFFELAARVWRETCGATRDEKVRQAVDRLDRIGRWLGRQGINSLESRLSPAEQLLKTFEAAQTVVPKRVFLARWYPDASSDGAAHNRAVLRLQEIRETLSRIKEETGVSLELIDLGTEEGATYPIHKRMYEAIASSDIIVCDLTGQRPNVFVEAGFALSQLEEGRLVFLFEPLNETENVPFDLSTFKYVSVTQAAEIRAKLRTELLGILTECGAMK